MVSSKDYYPELHHDTPRLGTLECILFSSSDEAVFAAQCGELTEIVQLNEPILILLDSKNVKHAAQKNAAAATLAFGNTDDKIARPAVNPMNNAARSGDTSGLHTGGIRNTAAAVLMAGSLPGAYAFDLDFSVYMEDDTLLILAAILAVLGATLLCCGIYLRQREQVHVEQIHDECTEIVVDGLDLSDRMRGGRDITCRCVTL